MFLCKEMQNICDLEFKPVFQLNSLRTGFSKKEEYFTASLSTSIYSAPGLAKSFALRNQSGIC